MNRDGHQSESNKITAAVATTLWAVLPSVKSSAEVDRPQAGGYNIYEIALMLRPQFCVVANLPLLGPSDIRR